MKNLFIILGSVGFFILLIIFPYMRCVVFHVVEVVFHGVRDLFFRVYHHEKYVAPCGTFNCYVGLFGKGKTLSMVHDAVRYYKDYNGKRVWWKGRFVTQNVCILSNVDFTSVPYIRLESLRQIVELASKVVSQDDFNGTRTMIYVCIDEASVQLNSRQFKSNIDSLFLNTMLTCRHYGISIVYTAQRFSTVDALLRVVTQEVFDCNKIWRLQGQHVFDAYELENSNPVDLKPIRRRCWFVRNSDYSSYDTLACVQNLEHSALTDDMESAEQILQKVQSFGSEQTIIQLDKKTRKKFAHRLKKTS